MDHVADALHVEDHEVVAIGIDDAFEFADQVSLPLIVIPGPRQRNPEPITADFSHKRPPASHIGFAGAYGFRALAALAPE